MNYTIVKTHTNPTGKNIEMPGASNYVMTWTGTNPAECFNYSQGSAHKKDPHIFSILGALILDAGCVEYVDSLDGFAAAFGYENSKPSEVIAAYEGCHKAKRFLKQTQLERRFPHFRAFCTRIIQDGEEYLVDPEHVSDGVDKGECYEIELVASIQDADRFNKPTRYQLGCHTFKAYTYDLRNLMNECVELLGGQVWSTEEPEHFIHFMSEGTSGYWSKKFSSIVAIEPTTTNTNH